MRPTNRCCSRVRDTLGPGPGEVLADAGSRDDATFTALETRQITVYVSLGREGKPGAPPTPALAATRRMAEQLASERGRGRYRRRKAIVEPVFGWIKAVLGLRRFSLRGAVNARGEWNGLPRRQPEALPSAHHGLRRARAAGSSGSPLVGGAPRMDSSHRHGAGDAGPAHSRDVQSRPNRYLSVIAFLPRALLA